MIQWIKSHSEYLEFLSAERSVRSAHLYAPLLSSAGGFRVGITIGKKVGKAYQRNRLKRRIKAWFRAYTGALPQNLRMNIIARKSAATLSYQHLADQLQSLMESLA